MDQVPSDSVSSNFLTFAFLSIIIAKTLIQTSHVDY